MTDWADEVDEVDVSLSEEKLPEPTEIDKGNSIHIVLSINISILGDQRIKTSYKWRVNEQNGKKELVKVTRTFDLVKTRTSKKVAMRKNWAKFGLSKGDSKGNYCFVSQIITQIDLGPQDSTTIIAEEVTMRFIHADQTEEDAEEEDEMMSKIRRQIDYMQFFQG